jgi:hypothetical protein
MSDSRVLDARIHALDRRLTEMSEHQQEAIRIAQVATEHRFESINEFRAQLADQTANFMTRSEALAMFTSQAARIDDMGRTLGAQMDVLRQEANTRRGTIEASRATYSYIIAAIGGFAGLVGIITAIVAIVR